MPEPRVFISPDTPDLDYALALADSLKGRIAGMKPGLEFFCNHGPAGIEKLKQTGVPIFLDLKLHDIPNTVAGAARAVSKLGLKMLTVHIGGGEDMLKAAVEAAEEGANSAGKAPPMILGVSVLTSLAESDFAALGLSGSSEDQVLRMCEVAAKAGVKGIVASGQEIAAIRKRFKDIFTLVIPGIRPEWAAANDQKRIVTPAQAIEMGASYLVIGRPVTQAADPGTAIDKINGEITNVAA